MKRVLLNLIAVVFMSLGAAPALAAASPSPTPSMQPNVLNGGAPTPFVCVAVPVFSKPATTADCPAGQERIDNSPASGGAIVYYLKEILKLVNGLIGGIIILVLIIAGVQYITSAGDPSRVKEAKKRITNAITALILYLLMFAILNFLIPGGIL